MPFLIAGGVVTLLLMIHCYKTGRERWWIYLMLFFGPMAALAYVILELLPELTSSFTGRRVTGKLKRAINPQGEMKRLTNDLERSTSVDTRRRLAEELLERNDFAGAEKLYRESRTGMFEHDPVLMLGQAQATFGTGDYQKVIAILDDLIVQNPDFRSQQGHLLYARAHAETAQHDKARSEFDTLTEYFTGPEAMVHYAQYLEKQGNRDKARTLYEQVLETARLSPRHYQRTYKEWIALAKRNL